MDKKKTYKTTSKDNKKPVKTEKDNNPTEEKNESSVADCEPEKEPEKEIPKDVLHILSIYPNMEYLYVGKGGCVYRNGTPENIRGKSSVLYKNPYFKK